MIQFKIYNEDRIRRYGYFPAIKDPEILEHTLLRIINDVKISNGLHQEKVFDIDNPSIGDMNFTYCTTSNFNCWGSLPLSYIYNDMIRHIKNINTNNNFIMTLESIGIDLNCFDTQHEYLKFSIPYEIICRYVVENYISSYGYMKSNSNGIMIAYCIKQNMLTAYILSVGFNPMTMCKWYSTSTDENDPYAIPYLRYKSLQGIVNIIENNYDINFGPVEVEMSETRSRSTMNGCLNEVNKSDINTFRKKSKLDSSIKYGNYSVDSGITDIYDKIVPACQYIKSDSNGSVQVSMNYNENFRNDFSIARKQGLLIEIDKKKKQEE